MPKCVFYQSKQISHVKWNGEKLLLNINTVKHLLQNAVAYIRESDLELCTVKEIMNAEIRGGYSHIY